ncbi:S4 domain protein [Schaalia georgiae F0490]|uniref:S4 domain protein n=1 Tax=Schaalia georgiae F0490 TaxID=1125717 RepID=J0MYT9_9ACTO|nr:RNA-binding S4 domain-containing protein [Schaalia georgiae]EJF39579.1 S4 domain protein [Schaalia georgiae F0490]
MTNTPEIPVRGQIRLGQFLKLASLAEDGAQARGLVQGGDVRVNGATEVRRGRRLSPGDLVEVDAPWGALAARVGSAD